MAAFDDVAARQISAPRKARLRIADERRERALREREETFRLWRRWHLQQIEQLLAGPYHAAARELVDFLTTMTLERGADLVALVGNGPWRNADPDTRYQVLKLINGAVATLREQNMLAPFDDALGDAPLTAFQIIREMLRDR